MDQKEEIFFQTSKKNSDELLVAIKTAVDSLTYTSESDAEVLAFAGSATDAVSPETILQQAKLERDAPVEEVQFDVFFERLTAVKDWFGEAEKTKAKKFLDIKGLLEKNLRDLKVYRFGNVRIDIFAVGIDPEGRVMGIRTKAVET